MFDACSETRVMTNYLCVETAIAAEEQTACGEWRA